MSEVVPTADQLLAGLPLTDVYSLPDGDGEIYPGVLSIQKVVVSVWA